MKNILLLVAVIACSITAAFAQPTANAGTDINSCGNQPVSINTASATNYTTVAWTTSGDGSFTNPAVLNTIYNPGSGDAGSGTVTLTLTANGTGTASDDMVITILVQPVVNAGPDQMLCMGQSIPLNGSGTGSSFEWSPASGLSITNISNPMAFPTTTTIYTLTTSQGPCTASDEVMVTVNPPPNVTVNASQNTVCIGESTTLSSSGATTYTWFPATGLSSTLGNPVTASPTTTTLYSVTGMDANGCANSS
jgi:hypothetical protein